MSITNKAQAIIDSLYMYITLVDKELYINGTLHEATAVRVHDFTTATAVHFLTMWCRSTNTDDNAAITFMWSQVSPPVGDPATELHSLGNSTIAYNIHTVEFETEDLHMQSSWSDICRPQP